TQRILDGRAQVPDLAAAVIAPAVERPDVDGLVGEQRGNAVRELNLAARAAPGMLELLEDRRRQHVAADDSEIRRRFLRPRLLDDLLDALASGPVRHDSDDAVAAGLIAGHRLDAEQRAAVLLKLVVHLPEARNVAVDQIVRKVHEEGLVADRRSRAEHRMPESERYALPHVQAADVRRHDVADEREQLFLAAFGQRALELRIDVEVILDRALRRARDEYELLDPGCQRFLYRVLT